MIIHLKHQGWQVINNEDEIEESYKLVKHRIKACPTYEKYLTKCDKIPKYLQCEPKYLSRNVFEKVALASYPRSGNSLLRKYLEEITLIITGSDASPDKKLIRDLKEAGLKGEGKTDSKVWIVKTHFPERFGPGKFFAQK